MYEFDGLGRSASWFLGFIRRGKGDVRDKKRRTEKEREGRGESCDIQESLERGEPCGSLVIARLPLAHRCIFRTEIKVYDARRDLKPNFPSPRSNDCSFNRARCSCDPRGIVNLRNI